MSLTDWVSKKLNLRHVPEPSKAESKELVEETYKTVEQVSKLREEVLEGRNFPIASYLRGEGIKQAQRRARR